MAVVDADTHVIETEETWSYLRPEEAAWRPIAAESESNGVVTPYWLVEDRRSFRGGLWIEGIYPPGAADLSDVDARLRHIDELGIDIQVLYPTMFISAIIERPRMEVALHRSYNRWLADVWKKGRGRLRWVLAAPTGSIPEALEELEFGKAHGACGVFMRGVERRMSLSDPYFFPLYEKAQELDLPIALHAGHSIADLRMLGGPWPAMPLAGAFHALFTADIPARFPGLRFGFIEGGSEWLPMVLRKIRRSLPSGRRRTETITLDRNAVRDRRFFITCQIDEDLPYIIDLIGEDCLILGTDYGHADTSFDVDALRLILDRTDVDQAALRKIVSTNAETLYGLQSSTAGVSSPAVAARGA